jgi:RNA polymerase sigma factor (sigma-70 family)
VKREHLRKRKRRPEVALDLFTPEPRSEGAEGRSHAALALDLALVRLSAEQREVIVLHWFGGLSFAEVAQAVGASTAAVKVRAHRGYVTLRSFLDEGTKFRVHASNPKPAADIQSVSTAERGQRGLR